MNENSIATEKFHVFGIWKDENPKYNREVDTTVTLELQKSGAFQYGNGTCVGWTENGYTQVYDTRYDRSLYRDGSNFHDWALNFVKERINPSLAIERI